MEFMLDTANLEEISTFVKIVPVAGVTSNPSIIKKEGEINFFEHMKSIRQIIGFESSLHVQVVAETYGGMLADAKMILSQIDDQVYIKVPVSQVGLRAIKELKKQGVNVTATAIYTKFQAYLAIAAKADYIAPYFNRMENLNSDACEAITEMSREIERTNSQTKILAASFKNVKQVNSALECGAHAATMGVDIINQAFANPSIQKAVTDFSTDWQAVNGDTTIATLLESIN
ncbi:fructose-6-phosphate aldolase [Vagococcus sp. BWB3-3]|uniref:Fructose-6-phosphate aldolase n=1 Tax=Vagococcus allomyrinae TaxID=2794353 RepID=A0A940P592_9ENTE|nr:fructose-6-phosphate aldolase [Vagococcus allomyrinae]MBP1041809.1 fructose-6-phosphate aldolase [Vagococcus allomyrinae]